MLYTKDHCQNWELTDSTFMTHIIAAIHGMNRRSTNQTPYHSKYKSQNHRNTQKWYQKSPHHCSILKKSAPTPIVPVTVTSTPIDAENIICTEDKTIWWSNSKKQMVDTLSPPPPSQNATEYDNNEDTTESPPTLSQALEVIKEFIQHDNDDEYPPLMSAIAAKRQNECSSYPSTLK